MGGGGAVAGVELGDDLLGDALEHLTRERAQQRPAQVNRVKNRSVLVRPLSDELVLELVEELEVQLVLRRQRLLPHHRLHGRHILADGVVRVHLVGDIAVVFSSHAFTDGRLHQPRQGRQHVDRRVDLTIVQLALDVDLALGDVARQVGDGMRDIVVGHGQDGELRDRADAAFHTSRALVDGRQIGIHVAGVSTPSRHLLARRRHLTKGVCVGGHVGEDDEHVLVAVIRKVLGGSEGKTRRNDTLNSRIVGQIQEKGHALHGPIFLEVLLEKSGGLHVHTHSGEHNGEVVLVRVHDAFSVMLNQTGLPTDLGRNLIVRETSSGKQRNFLATSNGIHQVNC
mmetsp:Transcript_7875/g.13507  ORF Transcript_7875/g.13507 Transcript_7875/m.13507 type:complete len:340 (-) Transcript_7875:546-1565(-)